MTAAAFFAASSVSASVIFLLPRKLKRFFERTDLPRAAACICVAACCCERGAQRQG